jgi:hypothetical protein
MTTTLCVATVAGAENATLLGMEIVLAISIILGLVALSILLGGVFMLLGAKIANVEKRGFGKAVGSVILCKIGASITSGLIGIIPVVGLLLAPFAAIAIQIYIIKAIFETQTTKAVLTWLFSLIAYLIVLAISAIIFFSNESLIVNIYNKIILILS